MFDENVSIISTLSSSNGYSSDCDYRRIDNGFRLPDLEKDRANTEGDSESTRDEEFPSVIYRFKFTEGFMEELYKFSKIHQYDLRKDFKDAWIQWIEENDEIIDDETRRLIQLGYDGDILVKMFKSARYYFRKKSDLKKEPKQRRRYISVSHDLLDIMDRHISEHMYLDGYQPKNGFIVFCNDNQDFLKEIITKIWESGVKDKQLIEDKIKKTYKNRYFMLTAGKR
jgi:hypothetical protein